MDLIALTITVASSLIVALGVAQLILSAVFAFLARDAAMHVTVTAGFSSEGSRSESQAALWNEAVAFQSTLEQQEYSHAQ